MFFVDVALVSVETLAKKINPFYGDCLQLTCFCPRNTIFTLEVTSISHSQSLLQLWLVKITLKVGVETRDKGGETYCCSALQNAIFLN